MCAQVSASEDAALMCVHRKFGSNFIRAFGEPNGDDCGELFILVPDIVFNSDLAKFFMPLVQVYITSQALPERVQNITHALSFSVLHERGNGGVNELAPPSAAVNYTTTEDIQMALDDRWHQWRLKFGTYARTSSGGAVSRAPLQYADLVHVRSGATLGSYMSPNSPAWKADAWKAFIARLSAIQSKFADFFANESANTRALTLIQQRTHFCGMGDAEFAHLLALKPANLTHGQLIAKAPAALPIVYDDDDEVVGGNGPTPPAAVAASPPRDSDSSGGDGEMTDEMTNALERLSELSGEISNEEQYNARATWKCPHKNCDWKKFADSTPNKFRDSVCAHVTKQAAHERHMDLDGNDCEWCEMLSSAGMFKFSAVGQKRRRRVASKSRGGAKTVESPRVDANASESSALPPAAVAADEAVAVAVAEPAPEYTVCIDTSGRFSVYNADNVRVGFYNTVTKNVVTFPNASVYATEEQYKEVYPAESYEPMMAARKKRSAHTVAAKTKRAAAAAANGKPATPSEGDNDEAASPSGSSCRDGESPMGGSARDGENDDDDVCGGGGDGGGSDGNGSSGERSNGTTAATGNGSVTTSKSTSGAPSDGVEASVGAPSDGVEASVGDDDDVVESEVISSGTVVTAEPVVVPLASIFAVPLADNVVAPLADNVVAPVANHVAAPLVDDHVVPHDVVVGTFFPPEAPVCEPHTFDESGGVFITYHRDERAFMSVPTSQFSDISVTSPVQHSTHRSSTNIVANVDAGSCAAEVAHKRERALSDESSNDMGSELKRAKLDVARLRRERNSLIAGVPAETTRVLGVLAHTQAQSLSVIAELKSSSDFITSASDLITTASNTITTAASFLASVSTSLPDLNAAIVSGAAHAPATNVDTSVWRELGEWRSMAERKDAELLAANLKISALHAALGTLEQNRITEHAHMSHHFRELFKNKEVSTLITRTPAVQALYSNAASLVPIMGAELQRFSLLNRVLCPESGQSAPQQQQQQQQQQQVYQQQVQLEPQQQVPAPQPQQVQVQEYDPEHDAAKRREVAVYLQNLSQVVPEMAAIIARPIAMEPSAMPSDPLPASPLASLFSNSSTPTRMLHSFASQSHHDHSLSNAVGGAFTFGDEFDLHPMLAMCSN